MECKYYSDTAWEKLDGGKDQIAMSLNLETQDLIAAETAEDIKESLDSKKGRIKADIFKTVRNDVLAPILSKAALDARSMGQEVEEEKAPTQADIKNDYKTGAELSRGDLRTNSAMEIKLDLSSRDSIHPIAALKNVQNHLAANIAETGVAVVNGQKVSV